MAVVALIPWAVRALVGVSGWLLVALVVACAVADVWLAVELGRLGKGILRWGDELGRGGFGLVTGPLARHLLRVFERWGARVLLAPWLALGVGLAAHRLGWWAPPALVAVAWVRMRHRRY